MLREARREVKLSQRALALVAGVPQPTVARIESGAVTPRVDTLDRLLRACGKDLELVERAGRGLDRTMIRERLRLTTAQRARLAVREWENTRIFDRARAR
ncbi:MAG: helix-turn-helix domain-containing protein [Actinomycetota bacterium]